MKKIIIFLIFCIFIINNVNAETIIYDNITSSNYKTIRISDDLQLPVVNEYKYEVYINNNFTGYYSKNDLIFIPDNSNITIYVPSNFNTDFEKSFDVGKSIFYIGLMYLIGFALIIFIVIILIRKYVWRR